MIGYATVITPRVTNPDTEPKPMPHLDAMRELIGYGITPSKAMAILERRDNHRGKAPEAPAPKSGKPSEVTQYDRDRVIAAIMSGYLFARDISEGIGMGRKRVSATLADLAASGAVTTKMVRASDAVRSRRMSYGAINGANMGELVRADNSGSAGVAA